MRNGVQVAVRVSWTFSTSSGIRHCRHSVQDRAIMLSSSTQTTLFYSVD